MNIGLDITSLIYRRGVSRYTANLVRALDIYTTQNLFLYGSSLRKNLFLKQAADQLVVDNGDRTQIQCLPQSLQALAWKVGLNPIKKIFPKLDVFHSWDWLQPPDENLPLVSTIHDLAILKYPETAHPKIVKAHQRSWKILKERQAHIIAVSHATKKDVVKLLDFPNWRVHVIPEALPTEIDDVTKSLTEERSDQIKNHLQLNRPYIFFVGTREPRKNLKRLIKAWQPLAKDMDLIIAGDEGWDKATNIKSRHLRFLGRVSEKELNVLYAEAEMFVYPSLYEGFGLPILEAFYHGVPVITSDLSAMIEVAGNAAELVNPLSIKEIRRAIKKIGRETKEKQRQRLQRMIIRLQMFSWEKVAKQTVQVYQRAINDHLD